jgi:hypothetical protein
MRRAWGVLVVVLALTTFNSCQQPPGTDGSLPDDWAALPAAKVPVPEVGSCYRTSATYAWVLDRYAGSAVPSCDQPHHLETFHVGQFSGADALRPSPPPNGSPEARRAYEACATEAKTFLGDDWRNGRLDIAVLFPNSSQWKGEARYFRCDAMELASPAGLLQERRGSLRDGLTGERPLALGCAAIVRNASEIEDLAPTPCTTPHDVEYAGMFVAADVPYPDKADERQKLGNDCQPIFLGYVGVTAGQWSTSRRDLSYLSWLAAGEDGWQMGNRGVRCYVMVLDGTKVKASLKGIGTRPLPR